MAITGLTKAAKSVANYVGRKAKNTALRGVVKTAAAAESAGNATADLVRKGLRATDAVESAVYGPIGKATRNASASVIRATRSARPRARETMGQYNARKGIVNKKYTPSENYVENGKMDEAMNIWKKQGMGKIGNKPNDLGDNFRKLKRDRGTMNINQKKDGMVGNADNYLNKPQYMHELPNQNPQDNIGRMEKTYNIAMKDMEKMPSNFRDNIKSTGPRYSNKQVRAGRKVVLGGAVTGYAASEYLKAKKASRGE